MKNTLSPFQALLGLFFIITLYSCGPFEGEEDKSERPKKIVNSWMVDTTALREEFKGYTETCWKAFEASIRDKDLIPQTELDSMKKFMTTKKIEPIYQIYSTLNLVFRADSTGCIANCR